MAPNFLSVTWHREAFPRLWVQGVKGLILVDALFPHNGGRREGKKKERRKKITMEKEGFPGVGLALLAVQLVAVVRCN
jgi:hypothetical protein